MNIALLRGEFAEEVHQLGLDVAGELDTVPVNELLKKVSFWRLGMKKTSLGGFINAGTYCFLTTT